MATSGQGQAAHSLSVVLFTLGRRMTMSIHSLVPDAKALLELEPEELAGVLMEYLNSLPASEQQNLNRYNFSLLYTVQEYPQEERAELRQALMEAHPDQDRVVAPDPREPASAWVAPPRQAAGERPPRLVAGGLRPGPSLRAAHRAEQPHLAGLRLQYSRLLHARDAGVLGRRQGLGHAVLPQR